MQNIINANQKSKALEFMVNQGEYIPFFKDPPSWGPIGIQNQQVAPYISVNGAIANKSLVIEAPPGAGFMFDASVSMLFTCTLVAADIAADPLIGVHCVRDYQWEVNGQPIVTKTKRDILYTLLDMKNEAHKTHCLRYAKLLDPVTERKSIAGDTSFLTYLPLVESFLSKPEKALLLDNIKNLQLRITFDTAPQVGLTNAITALQTAYMDCWTWKPRLSTFNEMVQKNWSEPFVFQSVNTYPEVFNLDSNTTSTFTLNCPFLAFKTHIGVQQNNINVGVGLPFLDIETVTVNLGGVVFLSNVKPSRLSSAGCKFGNTKLYVDDDTGISYDDRGIITINWGVLAGRDMETGTAFIYIN